MSHLRWLITKDLDTVIKIEANQGSLAWSKQNFINLLRKKNVIAQIVELDSQVIGFMLYELLNTRINLLRIGIEPKYKRKKIGSELVRKLQAKLSNNKRRKIAVEVRESNLEYQLFLRSLGFMAVEILYNYYDDTAEDAYVFHYTIN